MTPRATTTAAALATATLLLTGCGSDDTAPSTEGDGVVTLEPSPSGSSGSTSATPSPSASASSAEPGTSGVVGDGPPILLAATTAQEAFPGATVVSVEDEDDSVRGWEVEVVRPNGRTVALTVAPEGGRVTLGPTPTDGDDDVTAVVGQVRVGVVQALAAAIQTAPEGTIESVQLEDENGAPVWSADLVDAGGVRVDAVTGASSPDD